MSSEATQRRSVAVITLLDVVLHLELNLVHGSAARTGLLLLVPDYGWELEGRVADLASGCGGSPSTKIGTTRKVHVESGVYIAICPAGFKLCI